MAAEIIRLDPEKFDPEALTPAARALKEGRLVVFPTETVYGIAVDLDNAASVRDLFELKSRPPEKEVTIHISSRDELAKHVRSPSPQARRLMRRFWPGPLTIIFPAPGGGDAGIRYPNHRVALEFIRRAGVKVGASSANLSGEPPCVRGEDAVGRFADRVGWIVDAGETRYRSSSTVVRAVSRRLELLREGAIPRSLIEELNYELVIFVCTGNTCRSPMAAAMLREMLARDRGVPSHAVETALGYRIASAGTSAITGHDMTINARSVLAERGYHPDRHSSQPLNASLVEEADRIYVMTKGHREEVLQLVPEAAEKIKPLDPSGRDIEDPIWGDADVYRECASHIQSSLNARMKEF